MSDDSIRKRYLVKLFSSVISGIIGMIMVAIVPKAIGPLAYGQFVYLQQFFTKIIVFLDASSSIAFFTKLSADIERKELIAFYTRYAFSVFSILIIGLYVLESLDIIGYAIPDIEIEYIYLGFIFGFLTWLVQIITKISDAYAVTISIEVIKLTHKILTLMLLVSIIALNYLNLEVYLYFHIACLILFIVWVLFVFIKKRILSLSCFLIEFKKIKEISKEFLIYCSPLFVYTVFSLMSGFFDIWLLQHTSGSIEVGYYGLSYSIAAMCFIFTGAMTPIITREFSKYFKIGNVDIISSLYKKYLRMLYAVAAYFSVFIAFESDQ